MINRRELFGTVLGVPFLNMQAVERPGTGKPLLKLSCNLYSFNKPLTSGEMTLAQVIDFCADLGFVAVDPTGYYFPGYPRRPNRAFVNQVKRQAFLLGLDISGTGVRNNFAVADESRRRADAAHIKEWVEVAAELGAPILRVFAGQQDPGHPDDEIEKWVSDSLADCAEHAGRFGIILTLQNHRDFIDTSERLIRILKTVDSPWLAAHLDVGGFRTADPYQDVTAAIPYAATWQIKENVFVSDRETATDLPRLFGIIRQHGYRGYLPLETLGSGDPRPQMRAFLGRVREALSRE